MNVLWLSLLVLSGQSGESKNGRLQTKGLPVEMTAKGGLKIDLEKRIGRAENDVVIRRADVTICCDRATVRYAKDRIESVECTGRVIIVRPDGTVARADRAIFEADRDRVTLMGAAKLRSEDTEIAGDEIIYDIGKDKLKVRGSKSRFRFLPKARITGPRIQSGAGSDMRSAQTSMAAMKLERKCPP